MNVVDCKEIAQKQNKDLSIVEYSPFVKKLYHYKGICQIKPTLLYFEHFFVSVIRVITI